MTLRASILGAGAIFAFGIIALAAHGFYAGDSSSLETASPGRIEACFAENVNEQLACFQPIIRGLLSQKSAHEISILLEKEHPLECHAVLHVLGKELYADSVSVDVALESCPATCQAGCNHGVVAAVLSANVAEERIGDGPWHPELSNILDQSKKLCAGVDSCHTIGHVLFQVAGTITGALRQCDIAARDSELAMCYRGAFMESMQQNMPFIDGVETPRISYQDKDDLLAPCSKFPSRYSRSCYHFLHIQNRALFKERGISDVREQERIFKDACAGLVSAQDRESCFEGVGFEFKTMQSCSDIRSENERAACIFGASTVSSPDERSIRSAIKSCEAIRDIILKQACYQANFIAADTRASVPISDLCSGVDDRTCEESLAAFIRDPSDLVFDPQAITPETPLPSEASLRPTL